jgi:hypothetical protein
MRQSVCRAYKEGLISPQRSKLPEHASSPPHTLKQLFHFHPSLPRLTHRTPTADIGNASSPTMDPSQTISAHQPPTQSPDPESSKKESPPQEMPAKLGYLKAAKIALTRDLKRLLDPHNLVNILAYLFMWIVLAGFLVLPGSFPQIQTIVDKSGELRKVVQFMRNIPL